MVSFRSFLGCHTPSGRWQITATPLARGGGAIWQSPRAKIKENRAKIANVLYRPPHPFLRRHFGPIVVVVVPCTMRCGRMVAVSRRILWRILLWCWLGRAATRRLLYRHAREHLVDVLIQPVNLKGADTNTPVAFNLLNRSACKVWAWNYYS
jgi:hypothetical protein